MFLVRAAFIILVVSVAHAEPCELVNKVVSDAISGPRSENEINARKLNLSAGMDIDEYKQPHVRSIEKVENIFDSGDGEFAAQRAKLGPGDVTYDGGSGAGVTSMQLAEKNGVKAVGISAQDFGPRIDKLSRTLSAEDIGQISPHGQKLISRVGPYTAEDLEHMANAVGMKFPRDVSPNEAAKNAREILSALSKKKAALTADGKLFLKTGYVEDVLPQMTDKAKLITDVYGATYYSAERVKIVQQYYDHLTHDGKAFVLIGQAVEKDGKVLDTVRSFDFVMTKEGPVDLWEFLAKKHPDIFQIKMSGTGATKTKFLVISKNANMETLDLGLEMQNVVKGTQTRTFGAGGHTVPSHLKYVEKQP